MSFLKYIVGTPRDKCLDGEERSRLVYTNHGSPLPKRLRTHMPLHTLSRCRKVRSGPL